MLNMVEPMRSMSFTYCGNPVRIDPHRPHAEQRPIGVSDHVCSIYSSSTASQAGSAPSPSPAGRKEAVR